MTITHRLTAITILRPAGPSRHRRAAGSENAASTDTGPRAPAQPTTNPVRGLKRRRVLPFGGDPPTRHHGSDEHHPGGDEYRDHHRNEDQRCLRSPSVSISMASGNSIPISMKAIACSTM